MQEGRVVEDKARGYTGNYCSLSGKRSWIQLRCYFFVEVFCRGPSCEPGAQFPLAASVVAHANGLFPYLSSQGRDQVDLSY